MIISKEDSENKKEGETAARALGSQALRAEAVGPRLSTGVSRISNRIRVVHLDRKRKLVV